MSYAVVWLVGFGVLFTGYLVAAGVDYGVGVLLPFVARDDRQRRLGLNALGPFLLGNEAWLIVAIGMLIGTLPGLESRLLAGAYPLVVVAVTGAILTVVCVQLRSRAPSAGLRRCWDALIFLGGVCAAFGWGGVISVLAAGLDLGPHGTVLGTNGALTAFPVLGGLAMTALLGTHGAVFLAGRTPGPVAVRAGRLAPLLGSTAGVLVVITVLTGWLGNSFAGSFARPAVGFVLLALALVALAVALWRLRRNRPWQAFAGTATSVGLIPVAVFLAKYPTLVTSRRSGSPAPTLAELADTPTALAVITWTAGPVLLIVLAVQVYGWWALRGRLNSTSAMFY